MLSLPQFCYFIRSLFCNKYSGHYRFEAKTQAIPMVMRQFISTQG